MPLIYHVYSNDGAGGPVDYSAPVGSGGLTYSRVLGLATDNTFAVRAFDPATGLEEANTDARVRIIIDANGNEISARPNAPFALTVAPTSGGGCRASWAYNASGQNGPPLGFYVYLTAGLTSAYTTPAATVAYGPGQSGYTCDLSGLADSVAYTVAVRAYNATATEPNTTVVAVVVGDTTSPDDVEGLSATIA